MTTTSDKYQIGQYVRWVSGDARGDGIIRAVMRGQGHVTYSVGGAWVDEECIDAAVTDDGRRAAIRRGLAAIVENLVGFEQTTHGHIRLSPVAIDDVCRDLAAAYNNPDAYHISNLSQSIERLIEEANAH